MAALLCGLRLRGEAKMSEAPRKMITSESAPPFCWVK